MGKCRWIVLILIALIISMSIPGEAKSPGWHLSMRRIWLAEGQGIWGTVDFQHEQGQSIHLELLQVNDFYAQSGISFGITLYQNSQFQLINTVGIDQYQIGDHHNTYYRTGMMAEWRLSKGVLTYQGDLSLDDLIGIFGRYQLNYSLPMYRGTEAQIGIGNLLGSSDGYAFWTGVGYGF